MTAGADDAVAAGAVAWKRLNEHGRTSWDDWLTVARALLIGRTAAMQAAETNRAVGSKYNAAMGQWLRDHGLADVAAQERYRLFLILEHLSEIEAYRATLTESQRRKYNHPNSVWSHWKQSTKAATPAPQRQHIVARIAAAGDTARQGKAIYWPQECLRRGHEAMLACRSNDLLKLCRVALEAAVRDQNDLLALLPAEPPATSTPRHSLKSNSAQPAHAAA
jgi:hypothetical protein